MDRVIPFYRYADNCMLRGMVDLMYYDVFERRSYIGAWIDHQPMLDIEIITMKGSLLIYAISRLIDRNDHRAEIMQVAVWVDWYNNWMNDVI